MTPEPEIVLDCISRTTYIVLFVAPWVMLLLSASVVLLTTASTLPGQVNTKWLTLLLLLRLVDGERCGDIDACEGG